LTSDPDIILRAHEQGLVDDITASDAIGFDGKKIIPQAKKDQTEKLEMTLKAQAAGVEAARGGPLKDSSGSDEKDGKPKRGKGKNIKKGDA